MTRVLDRRSCLMVDFTGFNLSLMISKGRMHFMTDLYQPQVFLNRKVEGKVDLPSRSAPVCR
jgi:hypothetical protein